jgi:hypothetical protein
MVHFPETGLLITPYHPIRVNGVWRFPVDLGNAHVVKCDAVYSYVLTSSNTTSHANEENHSHKSRPTNMIICGVDCISLAHGIMNDEVASHDFFGTEKVVDALKNVGCSISAESHTSNYVTLNEYNYCRDATSKLICGILK